MIEFNFNPYFLRTICIDFFAGKFYFPKKETIFATNFAIHDNFLY